MESVLLIMTMLCLVSGMLKNSLAPGKYYPLAFGLVCALFVLFAGRYAVQINKLSVAKALEDLKVVQDVNIAVTLHFLAALGFAASKFQKIFGLKRTWFIKALEYVPALLVFPALFYLYLSLLFSFVGVSFGLIGGVLALAALLLVGGGAYLLRLAVPEEELRVELLLIVELLLFVLMVCSTIFHPSAILFSPETSVDWKSLLFTLAVVAVLFLLGYWRLWPRIRHRFSKKKRPEDIPASSTSSTSPASFD